jgi:hypothetical protein
MSKAHLTHLMQRRTLLSDPLTMCGLPLKSKQLAKHKLGTEDGIPHVDCVGCLRELVTLLRMEAGDGSESAEARWLAGGDTGTSSKTIWSVMTGYPVDRHDVPHDPADFGRCHKLLELFPAWRARLPELAARHPMWAGLVEHWDDLTAMYLEELPTGRAPRTYARMKELTP